eukprot:366036-Chlamydomonas_euryale.AAC.25
MPSPSPMLAGMTSVRPPTTTTTTTTPPVLIHDLADLRKTQWATRQPNRLTTRPWWLVGWSVGSLHAGQKGVEHVADARVSLVAACLVGSWSSPPPFAWSVHGAPLHLLPGRFMELPSTFCLVGSWSSATPFGHSARHVYAPACAHAPNIRVQRTACVCARLCTHANHTFGYSARHALHHGA